MLYLYERCDDIGDLPSGQLLCDKSLTVAQETLGQLWERTRKALKESAARVGFKS